MRRSKKKKELQKKEEKSRQQKEKEVKKLGNPTASLLEVPGGRKGHHPTENEYPHGWWEYTLNCRQDKK